MCPRTPSTLRTAPSGAPFSFLKDERELFNLANGFAIRHNTRDQRKDYDDAIWLSWAFYVYLAIIHAVLRLKERESKAAAVQESFRRSHFGDD